MPFSYARLEYILPGEVSRTASARGGCRDETASASGATAGAEADLSDEDDDVDDAAAPAGGSGQHPAGQNQGKRSNEDVKQWAIKCVPNRGRGGGTYVRALDQCSGLVLDPRAPGVKTQFHLVCLAGDAWHFLIKPCALERFACAQRPILIVLNSMPFLVLISSALHPIPFTCAYCSQLHMPFVLPA